MFRTHSDLVRTPPVQKASCDSEVFKCDLCKACWLSETEADLHRKIAHFPELISKSKCETNHMCLICMRPQESKDSLLKHTKTDHLLSSPTARKVEREIFVCDHCNGVFFNKFMLTAHFYFKHIKDQTRGIQCVICNRYMHYKNTWFHLNNVHMVNTKTACQICLNQFQTTAKLNEHLKSHKPYLNCTICGYTASRDSYFTEHLEKHRKSNVTSVKNHKQYFTRMKKYHNYSLYSGIKGLFLYNVHICLLCREICSSDDEMKSHICTEHMQTNVVKKKPVCACGKDFFNNVLLKHHVFKLKGMHRALNDNEVPEAQISDNENSEVDISDKEIPETQISDIENTYIQINDDKEINTNIEMEGNLTKECQEYLSIQNSEVIDVYAVQEEYEIE